MCDCSRKWIVKIICARGYDTSRETIQRHGPFTCRIRAELFAANAATNLKWGSTVTVEES